MLTSGPTIIIPASIATELMRCLPKYVSAEMCAGRPVPTPLYELIEDCRHAIVISATISAGTSVRQEHVTVLDGGVGFPNRTPA